MTYPLIKEKCLKDGCLFEDADFPAEMSSLIFSKKMKNALPTVDVDKVEWKHPHVSSYGTKHFSRRYISV